MSAAISSGQVQLTLSDSAGSVAPAAAAAAAATTPMMNGAILPTTTPLMMSSSAPPLMSKPTFLEHKEYRFLIMDAPTDANIKSYLGALKRKNVQIVCRACDPTYDPSPFINAGIRVADLSFADGDPPPPEVVTRWIAVLQEIFHHPATPPANTTTPAPSTSTSTPPAEKPAIAVHCVAGLGRAPVLVAIALIEGGMQPFDAIAFVRKKRRGAINAKQLKFLENYKPQMKQKQPGGCCLIQ